MPAGIVRVQHQFVSQTDALANGWTENWYYSAANAQQALEGAGSDSYINVRTSVLGSDFRMSLIRCSSTFNRADQDQRVLTPPIGVGKFVTAGEKRTSEQPWDALLIKLSGSNAGVRQFMMRGLPTGVLSDTMTYDPVPGFNNNLTLWKNTVAGTGHPSLYNIRVLTYPANVSVSSATLFNDRRGMKLTVGAAPPGWLVAKAVVRMRNMIGVNPNPNHLWRVQDVALTGASTWTITLFPGRKALAGTPDGPIVIDQVTPQFQPIGFAQEVRGAERKVGRPPALLRGRARAR